MSRTDSPTDAQLGYILDLKDALKKITESDDEYYKAIERITGKKSTTFKNRGEASDVITALEATKDALA